MKAIEWSTDLRDELKSSIHFVVPALHSIGGPQPWKVLRWCAKRITTVSAERVPVGNCEPEVVFHSLLTDLSFGIVKFKCKRIVRLRSFIFNLTDSFEVLLV